MLQRIFCFTTNYNRISRILQNEIVVSMGFDPSTTTIYPPLKKFNAIYDTGATGTVISQRVIDECGLKPIGMAEVHHTGGSTRSQVFLVNILLPNKVAFPNVKVTEGKITGNADVLIGMNIINEGDFAVTNKDRKTTFSFRMPSVECIDFVKQISKFIPKVGRNDPCPCGSGKKYKNCHGK